MADKDELIRFAIDTYQGCGHDMVGWDLEMVADFVGDRMYDEFGPGEGYYKIACEALARYF